MRSATDAVSRTTLRDPAVVEALEGYVFLPVQAEKPGEEPARSHLQALGVTSPLVVGALMAALVTVSAPVALMYGRIRARISAMTIFGLSFVLIGLGFLAHDRKRLEKERQLARRLERFVRAFQALPDGVIAFDRQHHIEWMNAQAEAHFALNEAEDRGQALTNLIRHPDFVAYLDSG